MTQNIEAVYSGDVLKPDREFGLRELQRVRLLVETIDDEAEDREAVLAHLRAGIARMQFFSKGPLPTREELHDRHLTRTSSSTHLEECRCLQELKQRTLRQPPASSRPRVTGMRFEPGQVAPGAMKHNLHAPGTAMLGLE